MMITIIKSSIIMIIMLEVLLWLGNAKSSKTSRLSLQTPIQWSPNTINAKSILNWKILLHDKKHPQHCKWLPSLDHDWNGFGIDGTSGSWTRLRIEDFLMIINHQFNVSSRICIIASSLSLLSRSLVKGEEWRILEGDNPPTGWKVLSKRYSPCSVNHRFFVFQISLCGV